MKAVAVNNLVKWYKSGKEKITAVEGLSFEVAKGELFGIVGPDGAGKTSLFRMLTTMLLPDGGTATVDGSDVVKNYKAIRNKIGYMPGKFSLYQDLTVEENLKFFATIFYTTVEENYDLIKDIYVQIEPFAKRRAGTLSGGMKQKLALSCALIHRPVVLFLDEPTTGVDAVSRKEFWEMLRNLKNQGITTLVSTPYMDEAALCDRVLLMQTGKSLSIGTPSAIIKSFPHPLLAVRSDDMFRLLQDLQKSEEVLNSYAFGSYHHVVMKNNYSQEHLKKFLEEKNHQSIEIEAVAPGIEDCFLLLMK